MKSQTVKSTVAGKIPESRLEFVPRSYDLIGDMAVVEIKDEVKKYEKEIAKAIMRVHKHIRTVAKKASAVKNRYRVRSVKVILGEKSTVTLYREHDCVMKVDVNRVYFSPRLNSERGRIASLVRPKENVIVFFAGVGPFALIIGKKQRLASVIGIELNPLGIKYFKENISLNRLTNVRAVKGDVKTQAKKFANTATRIIMPLPESSEKFLGSAFLAAKSGCIVHFYKFVKKEQAFEEAWELIEKAAKKSRCKATLVAERIVHAYSPGIVQVCIDFKVKKD